MSIVGSTLIHVVGFVWLAPTAGGALIAFSLLPVIVSAWVLGLRGGLAIGFLANVLNTVLLYLTRIPDVEGVL